MFDCPISPMKPLLHFLVTEAESLQNAALLLGGRPWLRRVQKLLDVAATQPVPTRRMKSEMHQLCDLLHLEHVHDLDRPEAGHFAELDPAGPHVPRDLPSFGGTRRGPGSNRSPNPSEVPGLRVFLRSLRPGHAQAMRLPLGSAPCDADFAN